MGRFIRGGLINQDKPQSPAANIQGQPMQQSQDQQQDSSGSDFSRVGAGLLGSAAQGLTAIPKLVGSGVSGIVNALGKQITGDENFNLGKLGDYNIPGNPKNYVGNKPSEIYDSPEFKETIQNANSKDAKQLVGESLGYDNLQPQSFSERLAQGVAEDLPNILLSPGSLLAKTGASIISNIGSKAAAHLGLGPLFQIAAGMGTQGISKYLTNRSVGGLRGAATKIKDQLYNKWDKYSGTKTPTQPWDKIISDTHENLGNLPIGIRGDVKAHVEDFGNKIGKGNEVSFKDIVETRRLIGDSLGEATSPKAKSVYGNLYRQFSQQLDNMATNNPQIQDFLKAQNLDLGLRGSGALRELASGDKQIKDLIKEPVIKYILGGLATGGIGKLLGYISPKALALGAASSVAAPFAARAFNFLKEPETRNLVKQVFEDALLGDKTALINNLKSLNDITTQENLTNQKNEKVDYRSEYAQYL